MQNELITLVIQNQNMIINYSQIMTERPLTEYEMLAYEQACTFAQLYLKLTNISLKKDINDRQKETGQDDGSE